MITLSWLSSSPSSAERSRSSTASCASAVAEARPSSVIEIIVSALFLLSLFLPAIPWGPLVLGIVTLVALIIALIIGGRTRRAITIAALVFMIVWLILENRWLVIPGVN